MSAQIIDGVALSARLRAELKQRAVTLSARGRQPGLGVILVGDNPASRVYVRNKLKACADAGIHAELVELPVTVAELDVLASIQALNADPSIHGILVQLPLPSQVAETKVLETIAVEKDVDGFHVQNIGSLVVGKPAFAPCTPAGCMAMLDHIGVAIEGQEAVVIGRSNIVGKPMALMLLAANATVTVCHSGTANLGEMTRQADVIVAAVGKRNVLTADMVKPGAVVIDVGMNRNDEGKLCGDVDFDGVKQVAGWITPVPGGVGPMTIAMLLVNTLESAERAATSA